MRRLLRRLLGIGLVAVALALVGAKVWLDMDGPYLEALPLYPYCANARSALAAGDAQGAIMLAEAGDCQLELMQARREWDALGARALRCLTGVWTGRGADAFGVGCAIASDVVVLGDVRDLTRQGVAWLRGEETDEVLAALSATGIALTLTPQVDAGVALLKAARRAGAMSERLAKNLVKLIRERAWRPLAGMLTDAGRVSLKVGPPQAARAMAYADDTAELATIATFVERMPRPLLGLKWGGKGAARLSDPDLYAAGLLRGPSGMQLVMDRGAKALLTRQPLLVAAAKSLWKNPAALAALVAFILRWLTWPWVAAVAGVLALVGLIYLRSGRRRGSRGRNAAAST